MKGFNLETNNSAKNNGKGLLSINTMQPLLRDCNFVHHSWVQSAGFLKSMAPFMSTVSCFPEESFIFYYTASDPKGP
jgi:hypothetical protein